MIRAGPDPIRLAIATPIKGQIKAPKFVSVIYKAVYPGRLLSGVTFNNVLKWLKFIPGMINPFNATTTRIKFNDGSRPARIGYIPAVKIILFRIAGSPHRFIKDRQIVYPINVVALRIVPCTPIQASSAFNDFTK